MIKKWSGLIMIIALTIAVGAFLYFYHFPFNWDMTFSKKSNEPFGCRRFDALMESTFKEGYEVYDDVTEEMADTAECIIYAKNEEYPNWALPMEEQSQYKRAKALMSFVKRGGTLVLSFTGASDSILELYGLGSQKDSNPNDDECIPTGNYSSAKYTIMEMKKRPLPKDTVVWLGDGTKYVVQPFFKNSNFLSYYVTPKHKVLMHHTDKHVLCYSKQYKGGGQIIYVACPTLLTNYGVEDGRNVELLMRVLQPMAGHKVIRIQGKDEKKNVARTHDSTKVFDWLLSDPSLRWALYLTLLTLVIFTIVTARRKRRAIPVVTPPKNATLEFARYMGNYFYTNNRRNKLVGMKYDALISTIVHELHWEVDSMTSGDLAQRLSDLTNIPSPELEHAIRTAQRLKRNAIDITNPSMMSLIHLLDTIKKKVKGEG